MTTMSNSLHKFDHLDTDHCATGHSNIQLATSGCATGNEIKEWCYANQPCMTGKMQVHAIQIASHLNAWCHADARAMSTHGIVWQGGLHWEALCHILRILMQ